MEKVIHRSDSRGFSDHGWLKTYHTFSYNTYYDPRRIHFGALRILNDEYVDPGEGFSSHPHDNMEIINLPLKGSLEFGDSLGNFTLVSTGEVHVMSAGTGVVHNEYNKSLTEGVHSLQIWIFPNEYELQPSYSTAKISDSLPDSVRLFVAPAGSLEASEPNVASIHQNAWLSMADVDQNNSVSYDLHGKENGTYVYVIEGDCAIEGVTLHKGDGLGLSGVKDFKIEASTGTRLLLIEVPMMR